MRTNAIVRIILFSLAILILAGILIAALCADLFMFKDNAYTSGSSLPIVKDSFTNTCVADASQIQNIEIEWVAGSIQICRDKNASNITVAETNNGKEKYDMVCKASGNTLKIQFSEESIQFPSFGINVDISKDLMILVPESWNCDTLEVDAASASMNIADMTIGNVDFDGASGVCVFDNCHVDTLDLDTASGDVEFTGTLNVLECDAVSANFRGVFDQTPSSVRFNGVSGDMDLTFPEDCGFTVALDSVSGDFQSEFPTTVSNGNHVCGDGSCRIEANGVSGNITIRNGGSGTTGSTDSDYCTITDCTDSSHHHSGNTGLYNSDQCTVPDCTDSSHHHSEKHH